MAAAPCCASATPQEEQAPRQGLTLMPAFVVLHTKRSGTASSKQQLASPGRGGTRNHYGIDASQKQAGG